MWEIAFRLFTIFFGILLKCFTSFLLISVNLFIDMWAIQVISEIYGMTLGACSVHRAAKEVCVNVGPWMLRPFVV
jgi:succinate-acetate transporter protein